MGAGRFQLRRRGRQRRRHERHPRRRLGRPGIVGLGFLWNVPDLAGTGDERTTAIGRRALRAGRSFSESAGEASMRRGGGGGHGQVVGMVVEAVVAFGAGSFYLSDIAGALQRSYLTTI